MFSNYSPLSDLWLHRAAVILSHKITTAPCHPVTAVLFLSAAEILPQRAAVRAGEEGGAGRPLSDCECRQSALYRVHMCKCRNKREAEGDVAFLDDECLSPRQ